MIKNSSVSMEKAEVITMRIKTSVDTNSGLGISLKQKKDVIHSSPASATHQVVKKARGFVDQIELLLAVIGI